jgi:hypothetical protein
MFTKQLSRASWRSQSVIITLALAIGCAEPVTSVSESHSGDEHLSQPNVTMETSETSPSIPTNHSAGNLLVVDSPVTVENGQVTFGPPKVTEQVEREVYQTLNYHRNLAREIETQSPGGNRGSQHSRQAYDFAVKSYMSQYQLSEANMASILQKGEDQGW